MMPAIGGPPLFANSAAYSPDQLSVNAIVVDDQRVAFVDRAAGRPACRGRRRGFPRSPTAQSAAPMHEAIDARTGLTARKATSC